MLAFDIQFPLRLVPISATAGAENFPLAPVQLLQRACLPCPANDIAKLFTIYSQNDDKGIAR